MEGLTKQLDQEFIKKLELVSSKVFPLPGATQDRNNYSDSRIRVQPTLGAIDKITLYEHIATIRHSPTDTFYIAFRQTMDCLFLEQKDPEKYPEWLMKSQQKQTELSVHIYEVKMRNGQHLFPRNMPIINTHEDWLKPIENTKTFDSLAYFLLSCKEVTIKMMEKK